MSKDTADYEKSEEIAIASGKDALSRAPWISDRKVEKTKGSFVELLKNDTVHPEWYAVHTVDGIGTKLFLGPWSNKYRTLPQDGIAMPGNDIATLMHVDIDAVNIYLAVQQELERQHMGEIMDGFVDACDQLRITGNHIFEVNIAKIETASLDEMISLGVPNKGWDVSVSMIGYILKNKLPNLDPKPGHIIVGVSSTGLHSNGYTSARHTLFRPEVEYRDEWKPQYKGKFGLHDTPAILEGNSILEAMLVPTAMYYLEAALIGRKFDNKDIYGINITGNGLHNFNRVGHGVSFEITDPMEPLPIHKLLAQESGWGLKTPYVKQNMGMGFAYIVPNIEIAEGIVKLINERGVHQAKIVGEVMKSDEDMLRTSLCPILEEEKMDFIGYTN